MIGRRTRIAPIRRNPDEAPKQTWYVAAFQYLIIIAFLVGLCVLFVFTVRAL